MMRAERFYSEKSFFFAQHALNASSFAIAAHRIPEEIIDLLRVQQRIDEGFAVANRERELAMFLDRASGRILHAHQHEIGHGPPLQGSRSLDQALLLRCNPGLQALRPSPPAT